MKRMLSSMIAGMLIVATSFAGERNPAGDLKSRLFAPVERAKHEALLAQADLLAPHSFQKAIEYEKEAETLYSEGKVKDELRRHLAAARVYFRKAEKATLLSAVALNGVLAARADALSANAPAAAHELWQDAEEKMVEAGRALEKDGDLHKARARGAEALHTYREAELSAIKSRLLGEVEVLLKKAEETDVRDRAPQTLMLAESLYKQAVDSLEADRYDTDTVRMLATQARTEARHALRLAEQVRKIEEADIALENVLLMAEQPVFRIAGVLSIPAESAESPSALSHKIVDRLGDRYERVYELETRLAEAEALSHLREQRIDELSKLLDAEQVESSVLAARIEEFTRAREHFDMVERMFAEDEALVLRKSDAIIIRLHGLDYGLGETVIADEDSTLLRKVRSAVTLFPEATVRIEGHTDAIGGDEANQRLSMRRANLVRDYVIASTDLTAAKVETIGFGETRPIASNDDEAGRLKNRRIDVVIELPSSGS